MSKVHHQKFRLVGKFGKLLKHGVFPALMFTGFLLTYSWAFGVNLVALGTSRVSELLFGLSAQATVGDYRAAPIAHRIAYRENLCREGRCLSPVDWQCGFTTYSAKFESDQFADFSEAVLDCFEKVLRTADSTVKLEKVQRVCGRKYMVFDPRSTGRTIDDCAAAGGVWAAKLPLWDDEVELLLMGGVQ